MSTRVKRVTGIAALLTGGLMLFSNAWYIGVLALAYASYVLAE